jgi:hypothetical protein
LATIKNLSLANTRIAALLGFVYSTCQAMKDLTGAATLFNSVLYSYDHLEIPEKVAGQDPFPAARIALQTSPYNSNVRPIAFKYAHVTVSIYCWFYEKPWDGFQAQRANFCQQVLLAFQDRTLFPYPQNFSTNSVWLNFLDGDYTIDHKTAVGEFSGLIEPPAYVSRIDLKFRVEITP